MNEDFRDGSALKEEGFDVGDWNSHGRPIRRTLKKGDEKMIGGKQRAANANEQW